MSGGAEGVRERFQGGGGEFCNGQWGGGVGTDVRGAEGRVAKAGKGEGRKTGLRGGSLEGVRVPKLSRDSRP